MNFFKEVIGNINGREINAITFTNDNNFTISFYNLGGYIHSVLIPYNDDCSKREDVILGYEDLEDCKLGSGYFNSIIGRVGNRISNSEFNLNNNIYKLFSNDGNHHLHGGKEGFNKKIWEITSIENKSDELICELNYLSKNLEEGYPGNLDCKATYTLNNNNEFIIKYSAVSDADTLINITNHNYWNFHGHGKYYQNISNHNVVVYSESVCENNINSIPTGKLIKVKNTNFDLLEEKNITQEFLDSGGIDNNYELENDFKLKKIAKVYSNLTRMGVTYFSDQPGIQFYTGNMMDNKYSGKYNRKYGCQYGLCLEPQFYPNAINQENFYKPILRANEKYNSTILMKLNNNF